VQATFSREDIREKRGREMVALLRKALSQCKGSATFSKTIKTSDSYISGF